MSLDIREVQQAADEIADMLLERLTKDDVTEIAGDLARRADDLGLTMAIRIMALGRAMKALNSGGYGHVKGDKLRDKLSSQPDRRKESRDPLHL